MRNARGQSFRARVMQTDESGAVLVIALILLLVLTLIGISAISTTTFETNISGNERVGTGAFYASEAGIQITLNQLPKTDSVSRTSAGDDSYYWSGSPQDKAAPKPIQYLGRWWMAGFQVAGSESTPGEFFRYQANATGESFGAVRELEIQARYGPVSTNY